MATQAQILANRSNAQKSTGPRTAEGKAAVAQNAVKHGLAARSVVVSGEDPGEFEFYRERMLDELDPVGEMEFSLAERIVGLSWRLKRAEKLQAAAFDSLYARQEHDPSETLEESQDADGDSTLGRALVRDFADGRALERMLMYERRIEQSLYRTMAELKRHRILAEIGPGKMWELRRTLASDDGKGGVSSVKCEVSIGESESPHTPAANLQHSDSEPMRNGVATNVLEEAPEGSSSLQTSNFTLPTSQTNPILRPANDGQVPQAEALTATWRRDGSDETKPIPGAAGSSNCEAPKERTCGSTPRSRIDMPWSIPATCGAERFRRG
jgi:hypothetical protein